MDVKKILLLIMLIISTGTGYAQNSKVIITKAEIDLIPEGITYDPLQKLFYISSIYKKKIIRIDENGNSEDFIQTSQDGFMIGLGLKVDTNRNILWACSAYNDSLMHKSAVFKYDLVARKLIKKFEIEDNKSILFNDAVLDKAGNLFITDTHQNAVYRINIDTDSLELWLKSEQLLYPNGITISPDDKFLYVASTVNGIQRVNILDKKITSIEKDGLTSQGIDGLVWYNNSLIGVVNGTDDKKDHCIKRFYIDAEKQIISRMELIDILNPYFNTPTTLALSGSKLFCLANSNIIEYHQSKKNVESIKGKLGPVTIIEYRLEEL